MADPVSIAASVVGLASVGFQIVKSLYGVAKAVGSAGDQLREYASDIEIFSRVLELIRYPLLEIRDLRNYGTGLLEDIVDGCCDTLTRLKALTDSLSPLLIRYKDSKNKLKQFGIRLEWLLSKKDKLLILRKTLNRQRRNLELTMDTIKLQNCKDQSDSSANFFRSSLESGLLVQKLSNFEHYSTQMLRGNSEALGSSPPNRIPEELQQSSPALMDASVIDDGNVNDDVEGNIESTALVLHGTRETSFANGQPQELGRLSPNDATKNTASDDSLTAEDLAEIDQQIENSLELASLPPTEEIQYDMRILTNRTTKFAREALRNQTGSATLLHDPMSGRNDAGMHPNDPSTRAHSSTSKHSFPIQDSVNGHSQQESLDIQSIISQTLRTVETGPPDTTNNWVKVVDSFGNVHSCAYEDCNTWEGICGFVDSIKPNFERLFSGDDSIWRKPGKYRTLVQDRAFHFVGPENNIIGKSTWSRIVKPGWTVQLEFSEDDMFNRNPELTKGHAEKIQAFENAKAQEEKSKAERKKQQQQWDGEEEKRKTKKASRARRFLAVFNSELLDL